MPPNTPFNLKQKFGAFSSQAQSAFSSSNILEGRPPTIRKKALFNPPWKRAQEPSYQHTPGTHPSVIQDALTRMIFQAGVDYETRPMVVFNASALPDPETVSYDLLLTRILSYLDLYVEADYTVVFFAAGSRHTPSWNWVWKAYRSLSRKYRKNLKQLYIVHSSFFSKMLFSLAGAIISPKFFRKLIYISTLSELAQHVPLTQIDVPPAVYQENLKYEERITLPTLNRSNTFGVPLDEIMGIDGEKGDIPRVVKDSIQYLRSAGLTEEGLFRRSPSSVLLRAAQDAYDRGNVVSLASFGDAHLAAVLIKKYLRDLPEPIFPENLYHIIRQCPTPTNDPSDMSSVIYIRESILPALMPCAYILLSSIIHLLHEVSLHSATNLMDSYNLAIVITPNLVKSPNPMRDVMMCSVPGANSMAGASHGAAYTTPGSISSIPAAPATTTLGAVIALCIRRYYEIFDEVADRSEAQKPWLALGRSTPGVGDSNSSSLNGSPEHPTYVLSNEDDEDLDDDEDPFAGGVQQEHRTHRPSTSISSIQRGHTPSSLPPSAWSSGVGSASSGAGAGARRHKTTLSSESATSARSSATGGTGIRSMHTALDKANSHGASSSQHSSPQIPHSTVGAGKAKSLISIEKDTGGPIGPGGTRRGSITIGRAGAGTVRGSPKSAGAAVEAMGVTAEGFFTAPHSAPPVPQSPTSPSLSVRDRAKQWEMDGAN